MAKQFRRSSITSMGANIRGLSNAFLYNYQYDQLNRLVGMDAWNKKGAAWNSVTKLADFGERVAYDPNGNILGYKRNGNNTFAGQPIGMDMVTGLKCWRPDQGLLSSTIR